MSSPSTGDPNASRSNPGPSSPPSGPNPHGEPVAEPWEDEEESPDDAEVEKQRITADVLKAVLTSENAGKLIEAWKATRETGGVHSAQARVKVAEIQAKHLLRSNWFFMGSLVLCLLFLTFIIWTLQKEKETLLPVLSATISLIAGTGGGYVFGRCSVTGRSE